MSDDPDVPAMKRRWIPRETWRQEGAVRFVKHALIQPFEFFAFDRGENRGAAHLWESKRGLRKATPDTLLRWPGPCAWFEFKAGNRVPDADQMRMLTRLSALGDRVSWGYTISQLFEFYRCIGVPMQPNAEYQALHHDGLVNSRIAKAEARQGTTPKKARASRPSATKPTAAYRRANAKGYI